MDVALQRNPSKRSLQPSPKEISRMSQVLTLPVPSLVGSLEAYIAAVNRFQLLTAEEELRFGRKLRDENDIDAARALVVSHLRVGGAIARGYLGYGLPPPD